MEADFDSVLLMNTSEYSESSYFCQNWQECARNSWCPQLFLKTTLWKRVWACCGPRHHLHKPAPYPLLLPVSGLFPWLSSQRLIAPQRGLPQAGRRVFNTHWQRRPALCLRKCTYCKDGRPETRLKIGAVNNMSSLQDRRTVWTSWTDWCQLRVSQGGRTRGRRVFGSGRSSRGDRNPARFIQFQLFFIDTLTYGHRSK